MVVRTMGLKFSLNSKQSLQRLLTVKGELIAAPAGMLAPWMQSTIHNWGALSGVHWERTPLCPIRGMAKRLVTK